MKIRDPNEIDFRCQIKVWMRFTCIIGGLVMIVKFLITTEIFNPISYALCGIAAFTLCSALR